MKMNEIFSLESENGNDKGMGTIHLIRDRSFFQAYEHSAYYMEKNFRKYQVHSRFFKNINAEMVYMGFPERCLEKLKSEVEFSGYTWRIIDEDRIDIEGIPIDNFFELWKNEKIGRLDEPVPKLVKSNIRNEQNIEYKDLMLANREVYDICLYVCNASSRFFRNFRFGLGERLRQEAVELTEHLHLAVSKVVALDDLYIRKLLGSMRIKVRLLSDLGQLNSRQWFFFNEKVEKVFSLLRLESCNVNCGSIPSRVGGQLPSRNDFLQM